jgi:hypothetical protein
MVEDGNERCLECKKSVPVGRVGAAEEMGLIFKAVSVGGGARRRGGLTEAKLLGLEG